MLMGLVLVVAHGLVETPIVLGKVSGAEQCSVGVYRCCIARLGHTDGRPCDQL
jgi:hypothetical protein